MSTLPRVRRRRSESDKGAILIMALGLLLLALSWVEVTMAHHLVRARQNAAEELRLQSAWAARDIWKQVDKWMADAQEFDTSTNLGLNWSGNQVQADPAGLWRSAETVDDELLPRGHSECDGTGISVCWRVDSASYYQPTSGPPRQTLAITVGVWCDGVPNPAGTLGQRGCQRFSVETRRYEHRSLIRYMQHYDTDRMPYMEEDNSATPPLLIPPPKWPHDLLGSLSVPGQEQSRIEFPDGYQFTADYHTNEHSVLFCGTPVITAGAVIEADSPLPSSLLSSHLSPPLPDGWEPRDGCTSTANVPGGQTVADGGPINVASGLAFQQAAAATTSPKCSAPDTPRLAGAQSAKINSEWQEDPAARRMWRFDGYLPPGAAWLAEAKAEAEKGGTAEDTHVVTHQPGQTYASHDHLYSENPTLGYLSVASRSAFFNQSISREQRDHARTVAVIDLATLQDGDVIWSSADTTEIRGNLPAGTATNIFAATVAAGSDVVLIADTRIGSEMTAGAANHSALALMAGCNVQVRVLNNPAADDIHIKNVAVLAPAGVVYARWSTACPLDDGRPGPCDYPTNTPPTLKWSGSIASRYKVTFGTHDRDGEVNAGYKEVNEFPAGWENTRFPWWPRLVGGTWTPA